MANLKFNRRAAHLTIIGLTTMVFCFGSSALASDYITLPTSLDPSDLLKSHLTEKTPMGMKFETGGMASGMNNVASLQEYLGNQHPTAQFAPNDSAHAMLQYGEWMNVSVGRWQFGYGTGYRDSYDGNGDAGQFWVDSHIKGEPHRTYAPSATNIRFNTSWRSVGRNFPFALGKIRGSSIISLRQITADDYSSRSASGTVDGSNFTGMMKIVSSDLDTGAVSGKGWALDVKAKFKLGKQLDGQWAAEGLMGKVKWSGLLVEDGYVVTPRAYQDPNGILHDFGGISGTQWHENMTVRINPLYRLDMIYSGHTNLLFGMECQAGSETLPNVGMAWNQSKPWMPYFRYYPTQKKLELGTVGRSWQFRVSSDDYLNLDPRRAEVSLSMVPIRF